MQRPNCRARVNVFIDLSDTTNNPIGFDAVLGALFLDGVNLVWVDDPDRADICLVDRKKKLPSHAGGNGNSQDWTKLRSNVLYIVYRQIQSDPQSRYPEMVHRVRSLGWRGLWPLVKSFVDGLDTESRR